MPAEVSRSNHDQGHKWQALSLDLISNSNVEACEAAMWAESSSVSDIVPGGCRLRDTAHLVLWSGS